jgi:adenylosuccinate lyase
LRGRIYLFLGRNPICNNQKDTMTLDEQITKAYENQRLLEKRYADLMEQAANVNTTLDALASHINKLLQSKYGESFPERIAQPIYRIYR